MRIWLYPEVSFYGLTIGIKILAINTPFLGWASSVLQRDVIETFDDLDSMMHHIKTAQKDNHHVIHFNQ